MPPVPRDPNTQQPIRTLAEYDNVVGQIVDKYPPPPVDGAQHELPPTEPSSDVVKHMAEIMDRVRARESARSDEPPTTLVDEPEDAWRSLGGGLNTFYNTGRIPPGREMDITTRITRGKGGALVTRVALGNKFVDVRVDEHNSNIPEIDRAKDRLLKGGGTNTRRPKPRKK